MNEHRTDPTSTGALYELALEWERRGDGATALKYYAETLRLNPEEDRARRGIGGCLARLGRKNDAISILRVAAEVLGRRGMWLPAIAVCTEVLALDRADAEVGGMLGALHDAFASQRRRRRHPPLPPQPVGLSTKDSVVLLTDPQEAIARAIAIGRACEMPEYEPGPPPPFFADISRDAFVKLVSKLELRRVGRGVQISTGSSLLMVVSGELAGGRGVRFGPGGVLGYRALIEEEPRSEELRAEIDSELVEIRRADLEDLARDDSALALRIAEFVKREILRALLASPMLEGLEADARVEILGSFSSNIVPAGERVIQAGSRASGLYLIGSGQVQITRESGDATAEIAALLGPGEVFGEIALLEYRPATASAIAVQKTVLFHLERARFVGLSARHPVFRNYLVELACARISENER